MPVIFYYNTKEDNRLQVSVKNRDLEANRIYAVLMAYATKYDWQIKETFGLHEVHKLIEVEWRISASVNQAIIGPDNGLSPGRRQAIIWWPDHMLSYCIR